MYLAEVLSGEELVGRKALGTLVFGALGDRSGTLSVPGSPALDCCLHIGVFRELFIWFLHLSNIGLMEINETWASRT